MISISRILRNFVRDRRRLGIVNPENQVFRLPLPSPFTIFVTFPHSIMLMNQILKTQRIEVVDVLMGL